MQEAVVYTNISLVGILLVLLLYYIHSINARIMNHVKLAFNPLKYSGIWMYRQFNILQFHVLPTLCIYVLCGSENKQRLFPYTTLTDWFV